MPRITLILLFLALATPAYAMHISEKVLPFGWAAFWFVVAAPLVGMGLKWLNGLRFSC